jgi:hypothetical protein
MLGDPVGKPSSLLASETDPSDTVRYQPPPAVEDRGTAHYIWADAKHAAFSPFPNATTHHEDPLNTSVGFLMVKTSNCADVSTSNNSDVPPKSTPHTTPSSLLH